MPSWRAAWLRLGWPGRARSLRMRCSAPGWVKTFQTSGENAPGPPRAARGWARPVMPCRTRMPASRAAAARASTGVPVSAAMSLRLRWRSWYCSRSQCGSMCSLPSGGAGWRSPALVRSCLMVRSLHPVMRAILRAPYPWLARSRSRSLPGGSGSGEGGAGLPGARLGAGWRAAVGRNVVSGGAEPGGDGPDGQAGPDERVQVFGPGAVRVRSGYPRATRWSAGTVGNGNLGMSPAPRDRRQREHRGASVIVA